MEPLDCGVSMPVDVRISNERLELEAPIPDMALKSLSSDGVMRLALAAVVEEIDGRLSYWALAHPSGVPDFHHPDSFMLQLLVAGTALTDTKVPS